LSLQYYFPAWLKGSKVADMQSAITEEALMIERRNMHRYLFEAPIELTFGECHDRIAGITTDIGLHGCFVKTVFSFPVGSTIRVKINEKDRCFSASGEVVYILTRDGMGIRFVDVKAKDFAILEEWVAEQNCEPLLLRR
jgi:hypothetical protein